MRKTNQSNSNTVLSVGIKLFILFTVVLFPLQLNAQSSAPTAGTPGTPAGSYQLSGFDTVNLFSGNLNFNLPLLSIGGRGEANQNLSLTLEMQWDVKEVWHPAPGYVQYDFSNKLPFPLSSLVGSVRVEGSKYSDNQSSCSSYPDYWINHQFNLTFIEADGTEHILVDPTYHGRPHQKCGLNTVNYGSVFESTDGSFMTFVADADLTTDSTVATGYLYLKNGLKSRVLNGKIMWTQDRNGNRTEFTYDSNYNYPNYPPRVTNIKDSIGRQIEVQYNVNESAPYGLCHKIIYKGFEPQDRIVRLSLDSYANLLRTTQPNDPTTAQSINQLFNDDPNDSIVYGGTIQSMDSFVKAVWLPNGQSYQFKYSVYGRLARIEMPTGGAIEYDYEPSALTTGSHYEYIVNRVKEKRTYNTGNTLVSKTVFTKLASPPAGSFPAGRSGTAVDIEQFNPSGNRLSKTRHFFYGGVDARFGYITPWWNGKEFKTEIYDTNGTTLLRKIDQTWGQITPSWCYNNQYVANPCGLDPPETGSTHNPVLLETKTTLADASLVSKVSAINPADQSWGFDQFNNPTDVWVYDYGSGQVGSFKRRTHTDYITDTNYTSRTGSHLRGLPLQTWVSSDSAGNNKVSRTQFEYDNYNTDSRHAPLVSRGSVIGHDTNNFGTSYTRRGNVTQVTSYANAQTPAEPVSVSIQYDILGNPVKTFDGREYATTISYSDNFGSPSGEARTPSQVAQLNGLSTFAFPTSATNALNHTAYTQFDYFTGSPVDAEDINGVVSSSFYNDPLDRPKQTIIANNISNLKQQTTIQYDDDGRKVTATSDLNSFNDNLIKSETLYDGLGRTMITRSYKDGDFVAVETKYDALSRAEQVSNPYRPSRGEQAIWTKSKYDALSRMIEVETPDTAKAFTAYDGNRTLVTDQAGKQRISKTNALGQLTDVWEITAADSSTVSVSFPNKTLSAGYQTGYEYDALNNLTKVIQGTQQQNRTFSYNSLSRLLSAYNPESGTIQYNYDNNGNLTTKTDARSISTTFSYDALNRVTFRDYSDTTPDVTYTYDNVTNAKGKLTKVSSAISETRYTAFDLLGRLTASEQRTPFSATETIATATPRTSSYVYNLAGQLIEQTYPSGRVVKNVLETDGDLSAVQSKKTANHGFWTYANQFAYNAAGAVTSIQLGNGKWESTTFNSRLQPTQIALGTVKEGTDKLKLNFTYGATSSTNNGNVQTQTITVPTTGSFTGFTATQTYTYDSLNRLKIAEETGGAQGWKETYLYDRYGNKNYETANTTTIAGCATNVCNPTASTTNNRLIGYGYDNAGNVITDAQSRSFTYNGENKQTKIMSGTTPLGEYFYDGDGKRVKKIVGTETTVFVYDASGKMVAEYSNNPATVSTARVSYLTNDHLGSPRITTDKDGRVFSRRDFLPFGEELTSAHSSQRNINYHYGEDGLRQKFTTYERDGETDLDFAEARMYNFQHGRFTAVDPYNIIFEKEDAEDAKEGEGQKLFTRYLLQPQNWNRYVYVWNNPLRNIDPTGEDVYVVLYTTGNSGGDEEFKRAAETQAEAIKRDKSFDPKKDTVLVMGVRTKEDVQKAFDIANSMGSGERGQTNWGKVQQIQIFSHAGRDGPVFHPPGPGNGVQWTASEVKNLKINWASGGTAYFFGCYTADFAQTFANAQNVTAYGNEKYAYFSSDPNKRVGPNATGPLYLFQTDGYENGTYMKYFRGNSENYPMKRKDPNKRR
jgi:RHS repeat-associated protein